MTEKISLYAYCRVSTRMHINGGNLENQRRSITDLSRIMAKNMKLLGGSRIKAYPPLKPDPHTIE